MGTGILYMNDRDWQFAIGELGDPLADVEWWMRQPYPDWIPDWQKQGRLGEDEL